MFSVGNPAFIFSAALLAVALIMAGLVIITGSGKSATDIPDQTYSATPGETPQGSQNASWETDESGSDMSSQQPVADSSSAGAVRVSFTVVSSEQSDDQE